MQISPKAKYILEKNAQLRGTLPYVALGLASGAAGYMAAPAIRENVDYGKYLAKHKYNVIGPMRQMGLPLSQALKHDVSKLSPQEFGPYRAWFNGPKGITGTRDPETYKKWRAAVQHHYHSPGNLHHYRALGLKSTSVPMRYRLEAVADWHSVSRSKGITNEDFPTWFKRLRNKLPIDTETKTVIDQRLGIQPE